MSDWDASHSVVLSSASKTKAAKEGAQVEVDGGAVEDVIAVQDVLSTYPSA